MSEIVCDAWAGQASRATCSVQRTAKTKQRRYFGRQPQPLGYSSHTSQYIKSLNGIYDDTSVGFDSLEWLSVDFSPTSGVDALLTCTGTRHVSPLAILKLQDWTHANIVDFRHLWPSSPAHGVKCSFPRCEYFSPVIAPSSPSSFEYQII